MFISSQNILVLLLLLCMEANKAEKQIPSYIKPCSKSNPQLNKCLKEMTQLATGQFTRGIKELKIPPMDPVALKKISIDAPGLKVKFDNVMLEGLSGTKINDFKLNLNTNKAVLDYTANLTMSGHYNMDGRIVILPIKGDGDFKIYLTNMNFHLKYNANKAKGPEGKDYWNSVIYKQSYKLDKAQFDFKNLYNGNKFLADTTLQFMNENWSLIMNDIAPEAVEQIVSACVIVINKFFSEVPLDQLLLP